MFCSVLEKEKIRKNSEFRFERQDFSSLALTSFTVPDYKQIWNRKKIPIYTSRIIFVLRLRYFVQGESSWSLTHSKVFVGCYGSRNFGLRYDLSRILSDSGQGSPKKRIHENPDYPDKQRLQLMELLSELKIFSNIITYNYDKNLFLTLYVRPFMSWNSSERPIWNPLRCNSSCRQKFSSFLKSYKTSRISQEAVNKRER